MKGDPTFTLFWRDGSREVLREKGRTIAEAMINAGYGGDILRALDLYVKGEPENYTYDPKTRRWGCDRQDAE